MMSDRNFSLHNEVLGMVQTNSDRMNERVQQLYNLFARECNYLRILILPSVQGVVDELVELWIRVVVCWGYFK